MSKLSLYIRKLRFYGWKYQCPICDSNIRKLRPFGYDFAVLEEKQVVGGGFRLNAQCPVCKATDRERLLYLYLSRRTRLFTESTKLLHIAPEPALCATIEKHSNIDYLTADISSDKVMVKMDITEIDYPDDSFDAIICNHVLEHIIEDRKAMNELYRVLKPGGWGIVQVPMSLSLQQTFEDATVTDPSARELVFGQSDHVRIYAMDYLQRLDDCGFQTSQFKWWTDPEFVNQDNSYGLLENESVFQISKAV